MKTKELSLLTAAVAALAWANPASAQSVTATISGVAVTGGFDYTILLLNTGTTDINSFWYAWTQSGNNLPSDPTTAGNSLGWANNLDGNSIKWVNSTGTALAPSQSGSFTFFSTDSPTAITTSPAGESVAYVHGIDFSQGSPGDSTAVFSPSLVAAPEPGTTSLLAIGLVGLVFTGWRKLRVKPE